MLLNFNDMNETSIHNFYGGDHDTVARMYSDERNRIMHGKLENGASIGIHTHENSSEIIFILKGTGKALYNNTVEQLKPGVCHYCPKGQTHSIISDHNSTLIFYAVVPQQ